ncbi:MAG: type I secretion system permease/ATPase [Terricaulis sp.]
MDADASPDSSPKSKKRARNFFDLRKRFKLVDEFSTAVDSSDFLKSVWRGIRGHLTLIVIFSAAINLLYLAPSLYMLQVYDRVIPTSGVMTLVMLTIVLVGSLAIMGYLDAARAKLLARASLRMERLGAEAIMRESLAARRHGITADNAAGLRELDALRQALSSPATIGMLDLPWTPIFILVCFVMNVWIGVLALVGAIVIMSVALINERASRGGISTLSSKTQRFFSAFDSDLGNSETVHALGADTAVVRRRAALRGDMVNAQIETAFSAAGYSSLAKISRMMLQSLALGLGALLAVEHQISPGAIIASSILTARAYAPVEQIVGGWRQFGIGLTALIALKKLFTHVSEKRREHTPLPAPTGKIQLEMVAATPPQSNTPTLMGLSFSVNAGEAVGVIGPSGAGKTTLARVLANAAPIKSGVIRIDGARYTDWDHKALSRHIGYMPQRIDLFDGTVADNISCFARDLGQTMEEVGPKVVEAAQAAGAHELILALPQGYETMLGPNGAGISPGQAQRIALARALYGWPRLIVLDEPNSHLDNDGEVALVQAIEAAKAKGCTCFIIAHRAGVISVVDKLMVLNRGQMAEFGPRDQIVAKLSGRPQPTKLGVAT